MNDDHSDDNLLIARAFAPLTEVIGSEMIGFDGAAGRWRVRLADGTEDVIVVPWPGGAITERREPRRLRHPVPGDAEPGPRAGGAGAAGRHDRLHRSDLRGPARRRERGAAAPRGARPAQRHPGRERAGERRRRGRDDVVPGGAAQRHVDLPRGALRLGRAGAHVAVRAESSRGDRPDAPRRHRVLGQRVRGRHAAGLAGRCAGRSARAGRAPRLLARPLLHLGRHPRLHECGGRGPVRHAAGPGARRHPDAADDAVRGGRAGPRRVVPDGVHDPAGAAADGVPVRTPGAQPHRRAAGVVDGHAAHDHARARRRRVGHLCGGRRGARRRRHPIDLRRHRPA
ncbi:hypothetical protein FF38_14264, partial [Lucilia cuprina]